MTNDIVALIDFYEREKQIDREKVIEALQYAFISAYRKNVTGSEKIETLRADIEPKKGDVTMFASLTVVADDDHVERPRFLIEPFRPLRYEGTIADQQGDGDARNFVSDADATEGLADSLAHKPASSGNELSGRRAEGGRSPFHQERALHGT